MVRMAMRRSLIEYTLLVTALVGILLAAYAVALHYAPSSSSFCSFSASWDCDKVNKSPWSSLFGIPVAILGLLSYLAVFLIVLKRRTIQSLLDFTERDYYSYLAFAALCMFGFQLYLTYIEAFVIHSFCVVCLASQACTLVLAYTVGTAALSAKK